ncbi:MAG: carotenoid 1,2-hydratase [Betaproteobacteria bacterium]|nr:carotenoid 1,2-hydratase [Betaproteobacteria bacterium]
MAQPGSRKGVAQQADTAFAQVRPGTALRFPRDEGSHPEFRIEWWYVTGWLSSAARLVGGFQVTFFRTRPARKSENPSAFTPRQILIAHAAISDPARGRLQSDQRIARKGFSLAGAAQDQLHVWLDDWSLKQEHGAYRARIAAADFNFDFTLKTTQNAVLQGNSGMSRKGPRSESSSFYYSLPQLDVQGTLTRHGRAQAVGGTAWMDHEWSSSYMDEAAVGWDWIGVNLDDGGALMAFQMRDLQGAKLWAGGSHRSGDGRQRNFEPGEVTFTPGRRWRSPRTNTEYPVAWRIKAAELTIDIEPLLDDQENDTRATTGAIYWEGAVRALRNGEPIGRGYLELTGYWRRLRL